MYYSITKRIVKTALGFIILVCAFAFAFFIIHFGNETESFDSVGRSFLKIFVMVLGEFEFDDLWSNSESSSSSLSRMFTMLLLIGLIILGSMIMVNLIVAIIISDIEWLNKISKEQALLNQVRCSLFSDSVTVMSIYSGSSCCANTCSAISLSVSD
jgi:hypothetical protein